MRKFQTKFIDLKSKYENEKKEKSLNDSLRKEAEELFSQALYSSDKKFSYNKAMDAYELYPENYQYKTYAISKIESKKDRFLLYEELIKEIDMYINSSSDINMNIYNDDEINSYRYRELLYNYIISLIENNNYDVAIIEIKKFLNRYGRYDFKVLPLLLNIYLIKYEYDEIISMYDEKTFEDVSLLIPISNAFLKLKQFKNFIIIINRIKNINCNFIDIMKTLKEKYNEIMKSRNNYLINTDEEIFYSIRFFYYYYLDNKEYINIIQTSIYNQ